MQENVSISTRESELNIKYGNFNLREERETARASVKYIYTDCCDLQKSYIRLGFHLIEFERCGYYEDFGYPSFEEFCAANIGLDKGAISRCMNVVKRFSRGNGFNVSMFLEDRYSEYSYSQLCEMLPLDDKELQNIKPDMTIKQIREYKKNKKVSANNEIVENEVSPVATSQLHLCVNDLCTKKGIVLQNHIAKAEAVDSVCLNIFDSAGKRLDVKQYDVLLRGNGMLYLREIKTDKV